MTGRPILDITWQTGHCTGILFQATYQNSSSLPAATGGCFISIICWAGLQWALSANGFDSIELMQHSVPGLCLSEAVLHFAHNASLNYSRYHYSLPMQSLQASKTRDTCLTNHHVTHTQPWHTSENQTSVHLLVCLFGTCSCQSKSQTLAINNGTTLSCTSAIKCEFHPEACNYAASGGIFTAFLFICHAPY